MPLWQMRSCVLADSSRETAGNIQQINAKVVAAVGDRQRTLKILLPILMKNILKDYDGFVESGHKYRADADYINEVMTSFTESVDHLRQTMDEVVENVNDVSTAVEQGAEGVTNAAENTSQLVGEMDTIMKETTKVITLFPNFRPRQTALSTSDRTNT